ncbi:MAG: hypothetical protein PF549_02570, partial [Patescibacteria group bacterium]|nr:hypothetical protein [Patescibacteria group bacterium]
MKNKFLLVVFFLFLFNVVNQKQAIGLANPTSLDGGDICVGWDGFVGFVDPNTGHWISNPEFYPGEKLYTSLSLKALGSVSSCGLSLHYDNSSHTFNYANEIFSFNKRLRSDTAGDTNLWEGYDTTAKKEVRSISYRITHNGAWDYRYLFYYLKEYSCQDSVPANATAYDSEESTDLTALISWAYSATDTETKCQYNCNTGYSWDGSSCVAIVNGSCGTRDTIYPFTTTTWPPSSTYCDAETNTSSPSFPEPNNSVSWTCAGSGGGSDDDCTATRSNISAPSLSFWADPNTITLGESTILTYNVSGADECTAITTSSGAGNWNGWKAFSDTPPPHNYSVTPTSLGVKTYRLDCSNSGGTITKWASVTVVPSPTCSFSYDSVSITSGETATATLSSTNDADGKMEYTCTNFENVNNSVLEYNEIGRSGTIGDYNATATWDSLGNNTSETCTFTAENSAGASANCSDTLIVNAPGIYS